MYDKPDKEIEMLLAAGFEEVDPQDKIFESDVMMFSRILPKSQGQQLKQDKEKSSDPQNKNKTHSFYLRGI